jgi:hypothetical protein
MVKSVFSQKIVIFEKRKKKKDLEKVIKAGITWMWC